MQDIKQTYAATSLRLEIRLLTDNSQVKGSLVFLHFPNRDNRICSIQDHNVGKKFSGRHTGGN